MFLNICGKTIEKIFQGSVVVVIYISCLSLLCCHASSLPAGIVLISRLSCVLCFLVFSLLSHLVFRSRMVLDCIDS